MAPDSGDELLRFGAGRERTPWIDRARRHPVVVGALAVVLIAGAVVLVGTRSRPAKAVPLPTVAASTIDKDSELKGGGAWEVAADGRPSGPPTVQVDAALVFDGVPAGGMTLVGIEGPGVTKASATPARLSGDPANISTVLESAVDCYSVTVPVDPRAYRLDVRVKVDGRVQSGPTDADAVVRAWAGSLEQACGAWLARRDVSVTAVSGSASPHRAAADLDLTITNRGTHDAVFAFDPATLSSWATPSATGTVRLPAGTSHVWSTRVNVPQCDRTTEARYQSGPPPDTDTILGVVATSGGPAAKPARGETPWLQGTGAGGVLFSAPALARTQEVLETACGRLSPFAVVIRKSGVHYDKATRMLRVDLEIDGSPGKVRDVRLTSERGGADSGSEFTPLWTRTELLRPDYTGQSRTTVAYRGPKKSVCGRAPVVLPGFEITARVPEPTGLRTVRFGDFAVPWQESVVKRAICP